MRHLIHAAAAVGALCLAAPGAYAGPAKAEKPAVKAQSATDNAVQASYRGAVEGHGYSARERRITDCLATYPGYDPKTDRVRVGNQVRRCEL